MIVGFFLNYRQNSKLLVSWVRVSWISQLCSSQNIIIWLMSIPITWVFSLQLRISIHEIWRKRSVVRVTVIRFSKNPSALLLRFRNALGILCTYTRFKILSRDTDPGEPTMTLKLISFASIIFYFNASRIYCKRFKTNIHSNSKSVSFFSFPFYSLLRVSGVL